MIRDIEFHLVMVALVWTLCQCTLLLHNAVDVSDSEFCQSRADRVREASPRNSIYCSSSEMGQECCPYQMGSTMQQP